MRLLTALRARPFSYGPPRSPNPRIALERQILEQLVEIDTGARTWPLVRSMRRHVVADERLPFSRVDKSDHDAAEFWYLLVKELSQSAK